ncbi:MAG: hypothetical protein ACOC2U_00495 [bacterium]
MKVKYFLVRVGRNVKESKFSSIHSQCWIPLLKKYDTPEDAEFVRKGYSDPENFLILSCYESE